jgi:hypothetical protein
MFTPGGKRFAPRAETKNWPQIHLKFSNILCTTPIWLMKHDAKFINRKIFRQLKKNLFYFRWKIQPSNSLSARCVKRDLFLEILNECCSPNLTQEFFFKTTPRIRNTIAELASYFIMCSRPNFSKKKLKKVERQQKCDHGVFHHD